VHVDGGARALNHFSQRLRGHVLIVREVGDDALQRRSGAFERPELRRLADAQVGVLLSDVDVPE